MPAGPGRARSRCDSQGRGGIQRQLSPAQKLLGRAGQSGGGYSANAAESGGRVRPEPVRGDDVSGEMYLLSYAQTASGARLTVVTRARGEFVPPGIEHNGMYRPFAVFPVHRFTARDDNGTRYAMGFSGRRGRRPTELAGEITLDPGPPPGTRWLEPDQGALPGHRQAAQAAAKGLATGECQAVSAVVGT